MTVIFINTLPGMICIDVMSTLRGMSLKMIGYTVSSYELEYSNDGYIYEFTTGYDLLFFITIPSWRSLMENKSVALAHTPSTASPAGHLRQTIYGRLSQTVIEVKPIQNKYRAWTDEQKIELS